jgi:acyl-CoA thioesterase
VGTSRFAQGSAVERTGIGRYRGRLGEEWNCPIVPHGGFVSATALRAMAAELGDPAQRLRSVSTVFAAQVHPGPVEIEVTTLRRGRSMSQLSATLCNVGAAAGHTSIAVFGAARDGFEFTELTPPADVPAADDCPSFRDPPPPGFERTPFNFWELVEGRAALGHAPWDAYEPTEAMRACWYRFDDPPRLADGRWDPLALVTLCDTMPGAVSERIGQTGRNWLPPSADLTVHLFGDAHSDWVLGVNRARHAGEGYASVDMELWDMDAAQPALVAYATQMMFFTFLEPPSA